MSELGHSIGIVVLAGGVGARMGGGKPAKPFDGKSLLETTLTRLLLQAPVLALSGEPHSLEGLGFEVLADDSPEKLGPMAGLATALRWANTRNLSHVLTAPCDAPFLPENLVQRLSAAIGSASVCVARSGGEVHVASSLWSVALLPEVLVHLAKGQRALKRLIAEFEIRIVDWEAEPLDPFFNVNTPLDLFLAGAMLRLNGTPQVLDLRGLKCPLPALKTSKWLSQPGPACLVVFCTDPMAQIDIPHAISQAGAVLVRQELSEGVLMFEIARRA